MAVTFIVGIYVLFLAVGILAGRSRTGNHLTSDLLLAGRQLPWWLATLTLIATWVGGGYVVGTAEAAYDPERGLLWTQAPWCFGLSLVLGGLVFATPMRKRGSTTMLDLFQDRYGKSVTVLLYLTALLAELCWISAILAGLAQVFAVMADVDPTTAILVSAGVGLAYTLVGGLWSVALTDALQLACIVLGLTAALPFAVEAAGGWGSLIDQYRVSHASSFRLWPGVTDLTAPSFWQWTDTALLLIMGGLPWQVYFQRVLACRSDRSAVWLSVVAGFGCAALAVPSVVIGMAGSAIDWMEVEGQMPGSASILPHVVLHSAPQLVALLALSAVAAAVMSSIDSSVLSGASMFAWNIYRPLRPQASDQQVKRMMRVAMVCICAAAAFLAIRVSSVYVLWYLSADLVYVILFPQLVTALFVPNSNRRGALAGIAVGGLLRLAGGEVELGIPALIPFPDWLPWRTCVMLASLLTICICSHLSRVR